MPIEDFLIQELKQVEVLATLREWGLTPDATEQARTGRIPQGFCYALSLDWCRIKLEGSKAKPDERFSQLTNGDHLAQLLDLQRLFFEPNLRVLDHDTAAARPLDHTEDSGIPERTRRAAAMMGLVSVKNVQIPWRHQAVVRVYENIRQVSKHGVLIIIGYTDNTAHAVACYTSHWTPLSSSHLYAFDPNHGELKCDFKKDGRELLELLITNLEVPNSRVESVQLEILQPTQKK